MIKSRHGKLTVESYYVDSVFLITDLETECQILMTAKVMRDILEQHSPVELDPL